jgi:hypothetical protein
MDFPPRRWAAALLAAGWLTSAQAQNAPFITINEALETDVRSMSLPVATDGMMTVTPCVSCQMKTLRSTASTQYLLRETPVSLADFRSAVATNSETFVTVLYDKKTQQLVSVTASIDPPARQP